VLHGCGGSPTGFAEGGYNALGALNDIIMVYPDTRCWDNEGNGIDPEYFNTNHGIVPTAFKKMIARVTGTEGGDGDDSDDQDDGDDSDGGEPSALDTWLEDQEIASNS